MIIVKSAVASVVCDTDKQTIVAHLDKESCIGALNQDELEAVAKMYQKLADEAPY